MDLGSSVARADNQRRRSIWRRLARIALIAVGALAVVIVLLAAGLWVFLRFDEPTPLTQLLGDDPEIELAAYDGSLSADAGSPSILILGTPHFAQAEYGYSDGEFERVVESLASYDPDMVVVEHLPPEWEPGRGRDTRPEFDLDRYSEMWGISRGNAEAIIDRGDDINPCDLGRAYFLTRDLANAHYHWDVHACDELEASDEIREWAETESNHEMALIGHPVANQTGVDELVSFDYQGDDAEWFIYRKAPDFLLSGQLGDFWKVLPEINKRTRELRGHLDDHDDSLTELLRFLNSPKQIGLQYWAYELSMPQIETDDAGRRQTDNYWLRNERMFEYMDQVVREQGAERVLVIVGAGHKYFLDELARDAGYRWIDPRAWLPELH